jgi:hyperosmotically inducible protein
MYDSVQTLLKTIPIINGFSAYCHAQITALLINDTFIKASAIEVTTVNGVVTLKGTVDSEQLVGRAIGLVNSQQGVKSVQNELEIIASVPSKQ